MSSDSSAYSGAGTSSTSARPLANSDTRVSSPTSESSSSSLHTERALSRSASGHEQFSATDLENELPPLPASSSSAPHDRKRRLTASAENERQRITSARVARTASQSQPRPQRYRNTSTSSNHAARDDYSRSAPGPAEFIDLTISSPPTAERELPTRPSQTPTHRPRSYVVPPWQPDSEVSDCPICHRQFGLLFRRHHCRKCGRVVCNECSPHRITIPRQYIVHPPTLPNPTTRTSTAVVDLTGEDEHNDGFRRPSLNAALGGGEKVRLCNPCVPDPQPEQLAPFSASPPRTFDAMRNLQSHSHGNMFFEPTSRQLDFNRPQNYPPHPGMRLHHPYDDEESGSSPEVYTAPSRRQTMNMTSAGHYQPQPHAHSRYHSLGHHRPPPPPAMLPTNRPRVRSLLEPYHPRLMSPMPPPPPSHSQHHTPQPPQPIRRRLREEDICPVCRRELPPKGENGDEADREQHIMECISQHDTSTTSTSISSTNAFESRETQRPVPATAQSLPASSFFAQYTSPTGSTPPQPSTSASSSTQPPPRAPTQMLRFTATEKDCVGSSGDGDVQQQECSICMVEYDVGDKLVRLECWCKFHEECIVEWFGRRRECPVHKISS